ncbi:MAG: transporter [Caulobacteraceae bacterium]
MKSSLFGAVLLASGIAASAVAQTAPAEASPDKSGFTLFDPTPDADLRSLCTDRPTKSTGPCTVDAGHLQIESDIVNYLFDRSGGVDTTTWLVTNPTIKLGLTNTLDGEINWSPYEIITIRDRATGATGRIEGVGDVYLRLKWALTGDDGGKIGFALAPYIKAPTARIGIGDGAVEGGLVAPLNLTLPSGFSLVIDPEADDLKNSLNDGRHLNTSVLASLGKGVSKSVTLSAELWSDFEFDPAGRRSQYSADLGAAWIPANAPNLQLDGGVNLGLNNQTPGVQAYVGISRRF